MMQRRLLLSFPNFVCQSPFTVIPRLKSRPIPFPIIQLFAPIDCLYPDGVSLFFSFSPSLIFFISVCLPISKIQQLPSLWPPTLVTFFSHSFLFLPLQAIAITFFYYPPLGTSSFSL